MPNSEKACVPMIEDPREIQHIEALFPDADGDTSWIWTVREGRWKNCDQIKVYAETGPMSYIPYFAVFKDGKILARVPGWACQVVYKEEE